MLTPIFLSKFPQGLDRFLNFNSMIKELILSSLESFFINYTFFFKKNYSCPLKFEINCFNLVKNLTNSHSLVPPSHSNDSILSFLHLILIKIHIPSFFHLAGIRSHAFILPCHSQKLLLFNLPVCPHAQLGSLGPLGPTFHSCIRKPRPLSTSPALPASPSPSQSPDSSLPPQRLPNVLGVPPEPAPARALWRPSPGSPRSSSGRAAGGVANGAAGPAVGRRGLPGVRLARGEA